MDVDEENDSISPSQEIDFCTLGMFIIDEIHYHPPNPPVYDILGGGGAYAALGARLFSPSPLSKTVSWVVDIGSDFPPSISSQINSWNTSCLIRSDPSRLTTRGWNGYDENQNRAFKYTTSKLRLDENSLTDTLLFSKSFHMLCSPSRCIALTNSILRRRKRLNPRAPKPIFIWEPVPDLCKPTELLNTTNALPYVDICSPNHHELATLMGDPDLGLDPVTGEISTTSVERACEQLLGSMPLQSYTLIVRCGAKGCYIAKNGGRSRRPSVIRKKRPANHARGGLTPEVDMMALFSGLMNADGLVEREVVTVDPGIERWLPAYFQPEDSSPSPIHSGTAPESRPETGSRETDPPAVSSLDLQKMDIEPTSPQPLVKDIVTTTDTPLSPNKMDVEFPVPMPPPDSQNPTSPPLSPIQNMDISIPSPLPMPLIQTPTTSTIPPPPPPPTFAHKVLDPTGGGNAFLGGLSLALARGQPIIEAAAWGSVAASFAIEQVGVPILSSENGEDGKETWNDVIVEERLGEFLKRAGLRGSA